MERLTKRLEDGQAVFHECHGTCGTCDGANCYCIGPMVDRLAAYEDTGLEPEEIKVHEAAKYNAGYYHGDEDRCRWIEKELGPIDHLRELLQAEHGGLLVALPCKADDTVYEISNNTDACNGCQHYEGIYGSGESWCMQIDDVDLRYYPNIAEKPLCEKQFMEVVAHKPEIDWIFTHRNDFGKTVFLTRAEAEQKLHDIKSELDAAVSEHEQED